MCLRQADCKCLINEDGKPSSTSDTSQTESTNSSTTISTDVSGPTEASSPTETTMYIVVYGDSIVEEGDDGHCKPDCRSIGLFCGDVNLDTGEEICYDGISNGVYDTYQPGCDALASHCGDGNLDMSDDTLY